MQTVLSKLELKLNEGKTQIRDARQERFGFLGFHIGVVKGNKSGKQFPLVEPSDKAMKAIKKKIEFYTRREMNPVPIEVMVGKLNQTARGWSNYFHYGHGHKRMKKVKYYMEERLRNHLRYRHRLKNIQDIQSSHAFPRWRVCRSPQWNRSVSLGEGTDQPGTHPTG